MDRSCDAAAVGSAAPCFPSPALLDPRDPAPATQRALHAWLALVLAFPLRATEARRALLATGGDPSAAARRGTPASDDAVQQAASALARTPARLLPFGSPLYPAPLAPLPDAPPVLFVEGDVACLARPAVAVVGARAPTAYGVTTAMALARGLGAAGVCVVSGLARGIDGAAHRAALEAGGVTVAVQGCGPDRIYPPSHRRLAAQIVAQGALVTELPPGTPPLPHHFPLRNRLISGLARAVVVVEARERSGSLGTALHAAEQDRLVFAVPGPIDAATSTGANRLLRDGAHPYLELGDVLLALGVAAPAPPEASAPALDPRARAVLARLAHAPATRDELVRALGQPASLLEVVLLELELAGALAEDRTGRLRATPGAAPRSAPRLCWRDR